jgi:hypothetical protein
MYRQVIHIPTLAEQVAVDLLGFQALLSLAAGAVVQIQEILELVDLVVVVMVAMAEAELTALEEQVEAVVAIDTHQEVVDLASL